MITVDGGPPASLEQKPDEVIDLGKERELRLLRTKVAELEQRLAIRLDRPIAAVVKRDTSAEKHGYKCGFHPQVEVSDTQDEITCSVCGEILNPYVVFRQFVHRERNFVFMMDALIKEQKILTAQVAALKKEKNNLSAAIRRKGGKPAEISMQAEMRVRFDK
jgi:hypothetical protein